MWGYTETAVEQNQSEKKIFIVNDDKSLLDMYSLKFKEEGFDVIPAFGSVDALEKLHGGIVPDAILLDITAPIMDSLDLLAIIRSEKLIPESKVIILSNNIETAFDEKCRSLGVNGCIAKISATPTQVVQKVVEILGAPVAVSQ